MFFYLFFFFKQKTAYEMRISDWSSDVCSSDLLSLTYGLRVNIPKADKAPVRTPGFEEAFGFPNDYKLGSSNKVIMPRLSFNYAFDTERYSQLRGGAGVFQSRSEEHTSELQSLMRISYAVFCLKTKKKDTN